MRKILPLFLGLIASLSMTAQGVVLEQDFENGLGDWMVADLDSLTYYSGDDTNMAYFENQEEAWIVISREGNKVAAASSWYIDGDNTANDWLISPEFKIGENNALSWRAKSLGNSSYLEDYMVVMFNMTQDTLVYLEIIVDEPNTWTDHTVSLSEFAGDSAYIVFINAGTDQYIMHLDDIKVQELNSIDVTLDGIDLSEFALAGNIDLSGVFTNNGAETVTSLDIEVSVNGTVSTKNISVNAESFETSSFTLENAMDIVAGSSYDVEVKIISVNGEDDSDNQDNMASGIVTALSEISEKAVLVEEYSGAWCGWCPDGARLLEDLMTNNSNVVGVTVHSGDDMEIADAAGILTENYVAGFPSGSIDRVLFEGEESVATGRYDWDSLSTLRASELTPVSVSGNVEYDAESREVSIKVDAKFFANISGKDYRVNAYILEDSVTGTGEGYDQVNYISGTYTSYFGWTGSEPGYTDESPVVGYVHMKVLRKMLGGSFGTEGVIASPAVDGSTYSHTYTTTLDESFDAEQVSVVLLVQEYNSTETKRPILNAKSIKLPISATVVDTSETTDTTSSIDELGNQLSQIAIYPNPTSGNTQVSFALMSYENITISVKNLQGQTIFTENIGRTNPGYYNYSLESANFVNGMYIVNIETSKGSKNLTLIKQ